MFQCLHLNTLKTMVRGNIPIHAGVDGLGGINDTGTIKLLITHLLNVIKLT